MFAASRANPLPQVRRRPWALHIPCGSGRARETGEAGAIHNNTPGEKPMTENNHTTPGKTCFYQGEEHKQPLFQVCAGIPCQDARD